MEKTRSWKLINWKVRNEIEKNKVVKSMLKLKNVEYVNIAKKTEIETFYF